MVAQLVLLHGPARVPRQSALGTQLTGRKTTNSLTATAEWVMTTTLSQMMLCLASTAPMTTWWLHSRAPVAAAERFAVPPPGLPCPGGLRPQGSTPPRRAKGQHLCQGHRLRSHHRRPSPRQAQRVVLPNGKERKRPLIAKGESLTGSTGA